jgi:hypothetical protein
MTQQQPVEVSNITLALDSEDNARSDDEAAPRWPTRGSSSCIDLNLIFMDYLTVPDNDSSDSPRSCSGDLDLDGDIELPELSEIENLAELETLVEWE